MNYYEKISELIELSSPPAKHRAKNAIQHIKKAEIIKDIDKNMALFRLITAVEEASTALFMSIKSKGYANSEKLLLRNHIQKNALYPFLKSMQMALTELNIQQFQPKFRIEEENNKFIVKIIIPNPADTSTYISPIPPLNFEIKDQNGEFIDLKRFYDALASEKEYENVLKMLTENANFRNRILYASDTGFPEITGTLDGEINRKKEMVELILSIYLMIDPYSEKQLFVQACLNEFIKMVQRVPKDNDQ